MWFTHYLREAKGSLAYLSWYVCPGWEGWQLLSTPARSIPWRQAPFPHFPIPTYLSWATQPEAQSLIKVISAGKTVVFTLTVRTSECCYQFSYISELGSCKSYIEKNLAVLTEAVGWTVSQSTCGEDNDIQDRYTLYRSNNMEERQRHRLHMYLHIPLPVRHQSCMNPQCQWIDPPTLAWTQGLWNLDLHNWCM